LDGYWVQLFTLGHFNGCPPGAVTGDARDYREKKINLSVLYPSLKEYEAKGILNMLRPPEVCDPNYHLFCVIFNKEAIRDHVLRELNGRGVNASIHFLPLHSSPMEKNWVIPPMT
jgi:dTDP-4-amino-4,6-dideoxygalactose transaminase